MADWFRSWHGAPTDAKWRTIAKRAKTPTSLVVAAAWALLDRASQNEARGSIEGIDIETLADFLDCEAEEIERIIKAMREKCVLTDDFFAMWEKRQPLREDGSAERARAWRELKKQEKDEAERRRSSANDPDENEQSERLRTEANAEKHRAEAEQTRLEKIDAAARTREPISLGRLEHELRSAAALETDPRPALCDLSSMLGLLDAGYDFESEILPVIRAKRRKGINSWAYFVPMVHEARQARTAAASTRPDARAGPVAPRPTRGVESALAGIKRYHEAQPQD